MPDEAVLPAPSERGGDAPSRRPGRTTALILALLLLLAGSVYALVAWRTADPLVVDGNLVTKGGERWVAKGATLYVWPYSDDYADAEGDEQYEARATIFDRMEALGMNAVRIPVSPRSDVHDRHGGLDGYTTKLATLAADANARGLTVSFCNWESLFAGEDWPADWEEHQVVMDDLMDKVGAANPGVIWEPFNEPNDVSTAEWRDTTEAVIRHYRGTLGYEGVLQIDTPGWSWEVPMKEIRQLIALDATLTGTDESNLVVANHRYGNDDTDFSASSTDPVFANMDEIPIVGTEHGFHNGPQGGTDSWMSDYLSYLGEDAVADGHGGAYVFAWHWADDNRVTEDDYSTLTPQGTIWVEDYLASLPPGL
ncbi:cellulase family glycosylhydrolase [Cellulomonas aerilata]|uniref:Glycoside hydrolase family 5 domain-containing protein n=1 Tax=Cellulomonas aerilata TaxID=515326 RepID=A0A512D863_9CELL|nr:cellulase family glycosylhydrolase [Cellulomonas aerilata]GEO32678.1 hypothetical protein CAE01nite_04030 [Cellulomonas aerilata]